MKIGMSYGVLLAAGCLAFAQTGFVQMALASAAPKQLYDKSVTLSWSESSTNRRLSDGGMANPVGNFEIIAYVSSAGRIFRRRSFVAGRYAKSGDRGPDDKGTGSATFEGNSLVLQGVNGAVARRLVASFDSAYSSCTLSVTVGKAGASPKWTGFDGAQYELLTVSVGTSSCSIRDGNAFGGQ